MKTLDTYLSLCTQVYDISKPTPPEDAYAFYKSYVSKASGPLLEPMCGTGRFLLPLLQDGFPVEGFDASEHMLTTLREKAKIKNLHPEIWQSFVEDLKRPKLYNLIFIPSGSFGLITNLDVAQTALKKIYDHLAPNGIFVFEAETLQAAPTEVGTWRGSFYSRSDGNIIIAHFLDTPLQDNIGTSIAKYELVNKNQVVQTEIEKFEVRYYEPDHLVALLENAGFQSVRLVKAFDRSQAPDDNDTVIVYECKK